jgi:hypothetical protein
MTRRSARVLARKESKVRTTVPTRRTYLAAVTTDALVPFRPASFRPPANNRDRSSTPKAFGICFNCSKSRHLARDCPEPKRQYNINEISSSDDKEEKVEVVEDSEEESSEDSENE